MMAKILYAEDSDDNVYMLERRLRRLGHEVIIAADGGAAVELAHSELPDLVIMDLSLPNVDGWEATRRLKASPRTTAIPIIALSAHAMPGDREGALAAGCDDYDVKPVDFGRLLEKLRALLPSGSLS
jgi:two-component system, cell cycle response regulator DivK